MRSIICTKPGTLETVESPDPTPTPGHLIVRIRRVGICGTDLHAFKGVQPYFTYPRILGHEIAAEVVDTGGSHRFRSGDEITIIPYRHCGACHACRTGKTNCCMNLQVLGVHADGGMVQYLSIPEDMALAGSGLTPTAQACVEPLAIGAHALRQAQARSGDWLVLLGAGPIGIGIAALALRKNLSLIVLEPDEQRREFCSTRLGVPHVLDPYSADTRTMIGELTAGRFADIVMDATGNLKALESMIGFLGHGGKMIMVGLQKQPFSFDHPEFHRREATLMSSRNATREDFQTVMEFLRTETAFADQYVTHDLDAAHADDGFKEILASTPAHALHRSDDAGSTSIIKVHMLF